MTVDSDTQTLSVVSIVDDVHGRIDEAMAHVAAVAGEPLATALRAAGEGMGGTNQDLLNAYDHVVFELSRHLVGMEVAVCSMVEHRVPDGRRMVRTHMRRSRELETTVRSIEQLLWGDALAQTLRLDLLHADLTESMRAHRDEEAEMLAALDAVLAPEERAALATRLERATRRAPTRSHPHAPRRLGWTRTFYLPVAGWDRFLDTMSSRNYSRLVQPARSVGLWGSYLLGKPLGPQAEAQDGDGAEAEPVDEAAGGGANTA